MNIPQSHCWTRIEASEASAFTLTVAAPAALQHRDGYLASLPTLEAERSEAQKHR